MSIDPRVANRPLPRPITLNQQFEFSSSQIVLSKQEAWYVLAYFFDHPGILTADLTENDLSFAQALLIESIEQSYDANMLWGNRPTYLSKEINKVVIAVLKKTGGKWNWTASLESLLKHHEKQELNYRVKDKMTQTYIWDWITRVRTGIQAYHGIPAS